MHVFRDISIKQRLMRISLFTAGLALIVTVLSLTINEVILFQKSLLNELITQTEIIGNNCTAALTFNDAKAAKEILSALKANRHIDLAQIYAKDGSLFADYSLDNEKYDVPLLLHKKGHRFGLNYIDVYHNIVLDNEVIGYIYIHSNLHALYVNLFRYACIFLAVILLAMSVVYVLSSRLQKTITVPISDLVRTMNTVSEEKNYSVRAAVQSKDELGALAEGFNEMLTQIQRELTEREKAEKEVQQVKNALQMREAFLTSIIENQPGFMWLKDIEGRFLAVNHAFAVACQRQTPGEVEGKTDFEVWPHELAEKYRADDAKVMRNNQSVTVEEIVYDKSEAKWFETFNTPVRDMSGKIIGTTGYSHDISERKRVEEEIQKEKAFSEAMLFSLPGIFALFDHTGRFLRWNRAFEAISGYSAEEIAAVSLLDFFTGDDRTLMEETIGKVFDTGSADIDAMFLSKYGKRTPYYFIGVRFVLGGVPCCLGIGIDITERRHLEAQLRHAQKMEAVGTLAGGIAHDFNNILNVILGYGNMVMDTLESDTPSKENMNEVLIAAERAANLTKRLLVFSRKQVVEVQPVNINELILDLKKMLVRTIRENIELKLELAEMPLIVQADAGQIEQVMMNLATNGRDAMPEGGRLTIGTGIQEIDDEYIAMNGYGEPGRYALITVADTGQGIDAETQKKIFEPFFTTKGIGEGTGLGLAISYGIIKQHNGYIKAYSETGKGTIFKIYLPLVEETADQDNEAVAAIPVNGGNETILVAEDDASLMKLKRIVLESYGYRVICAEDGEDAIAKFMGDKDKIQLAILDMIMPKKNGKEVSEAIRKVSPKTKILFTSGYTMDIIKTREFAEAGFDFLLKPIASKDLLRKVREVLDK